MYICLVVLNHFRVIKLILNLYRHGFWGWGRDGQCEGRYAHILAPMCTQVQGRVGCWYSCQSVREHSDPKELFNEVTLHTNTYICI